MLSAIVMHKAGDLPAEDLKRAWHLEIMTSRIQVPTLALELLACLAGSSTCLARCQKYRDYVLRPLATSTDLENLGNLTNVLMMQGAAVGKYIMRFYIAQLSKMAQQTKENLQPVPSCLMNGITLRSHGPYLFVYPHGLPFQAGYLTGYIEFGEIEVSSKNSELTFTITNTSPPSQSQDYFLLERIQLVRSSWSWSWTSKPGRLIALTNTLEMQNSTNSGLSVCPLLQCSFWFETVVWA